MIGAIAASLEFYRMTEFSMTVSPSTIVHLPCLITSHARKSASAPPPVAELSHAP